MIARATPFGIQIGEEWEKLPDSQKVAIIFHENAHISLGHVWKRWWWLLSFRWVNLRWLRCACIEQELEADRAAALRGYAKPLAQFILARTKDQGSWHPSHEERIKQLTEYF